MNMQRAAILFLVLLPVLCGTGTSQSPSGVVVNEIFTGNPDWIEIANTGLSPVTLDGWRVEATFSFTLYPAFVFPAGTTLGAGECLVVLENSGSVTSVTNPHPFATQIHNTHFGYGWIGTSTGAVALIDAAGVCQDLVVFGNTPFLPPPGSGGATFTGHFDRFANDPALGNVVRRHREIDTDDGGDFEQLQNGAETPGRANPGQEFGLPTVMRLELAPVPVQIDDSSATLQTSFTISSILLDEGMSFTTSSQDALVGGSFMLSGSIIGTCPDDLGGLLLVPVQMIATDLNGGQLAMTGVIAAETELEQSLGGAQSATPIVQRAISSRSLSSSTLSGQPSAALLSLHAAAQAGRIYFVVRLDASGPWLDRVDVVRDPNAPPQALESKLAALPGGGLELGVIGANPNADLFNVFVVNPTLPLGGGPVEGIEWGDGQWQQVLLPLHSHPFHVAPVAPGLYHFAAPAGTVPFGVWLDHVAIQLENGLPVFSEPTRAFF